MHPGACEIARLEWNLGWIGDCAGGQAENRNVNKERLSVRKALNSRLVGDCLAWQGGPSKTFSLWTHAHLKHLMAYAQRICYSSTVSNFFHWEGSPR